MPVSSLPSRTGVGEMGAEAYHFLTLLKESGIRIWQILPMNPVGYGNSPYQHILPVQGMSYISVWIRCMRKGC